MRAGSWILVLASFAGAGGDGELEQLIDRLSSPDIYVREAAQRALEALDDASRPRLREFDPEDAEPRRVLGQLLRAPGALQLDARLLEKSVRLGSPVVVEFTLRDDPALSSRVVLGAALSSTRAPAGGWLPTAMRDEEEGGRSWTVTIAAQQLPFRRPGRHEFRLYVAFQALTEEQPLGSAEAEHVTSAALHVELSGRTPQELEAALRSPKEEEREGALAELGVREDEDLLPMLREEAPRLPPEWQAAVLRRFGEAARDEDLPFVLERARDAEADPRVRKEATRALAGFRHEKALQALWLLASETAVHMEAVEALTHFRRKTTVMKFLSLLKYPRGTSDEARKRITETLYEWTGVHVAARATEVRKFEIWWSENHSSFREE